MNTNETSGAMLQALAEKYASVLGTTVLSSREHDGTITFTLTSGPKYTMTEAELIAVIDASQGITDKPAPPAEATAEAEDDKPKRKAKTK